MQAPRRRRRFGSPRATQGPARPEQARRIWTATRRRRWFCSPPTTQGGSIEANARPEDACVGSAARWPSGRGRGRRAIFERPPGPRTRSGRRRRGRPTAADGMGWPVVSKTTTDAAPGSPVARSTGAWQGGQAVRGELYLVHALKRRFAHLAAAGTNSGPGQEQESAHYVVPMRCADNTHISCEAPARRPLVRGIPRSPTTRGSPGARRAQ